MPEELPDGEDYGIVGDDDESDPPAGPASEPEGEIELEDGVGEVGLPEELAADGPEPEPLEVAADGPEPEPLEVAGESEPPVMMDSDDEVVHVTPEPQPLKKCPVFSEPKTSNPSSRLRELQLRLETLKQGAQLQQVAKVRVALVCLRQFLYVLRLLARQLKMRSVTKSSGDIAGPLTF